MDMLKKLLNSLFFTLFLFFGILVGCKEDSVEPFLYRNKEVLEFDYSEGEQRITIVTNEDWRISTEDSDWISFDAEEGVGTSNPEYIKIIVGRNLGEDREGKVVLRSGNQQHEVRILQKEGKVTFGTPEAIGSLVKDWNVAPYSIAIPYDKGLLAEPLTVSVHTEGLGAAGIVQEDFVVSLDKKSGNIVLPLRGRLTATGQVAFHVTMSSGEKWVINEIVHSPIVLKIASVGLYNTNALIEPLANALKVLDPDFVLVREIDQANLRSGKTIKQGEEVARYAGMYEYFSDGQDYREGLFGVSLLSKYPILAQKKVRIPTNRTGAIISAALPSGKIIDFVGCQLENRPETQYDADRTVQATILADYAKNVQNPTVLALGMAMTNVATDPALAVLKAQYVSGCTVCQYNHQKPTYTQFMDHIMYKKNEAYKFNVRRYEVLDAPTRGGIVYAELELTQ